MTRIREIRKSKGLRLVDIAHAIGDNCQPSTVQKWETGAVPITVENLRRVAAALGVSVAELIEEPQKVASE